LNNYFKNDFKKWHIAFVVPYTLTFIAGLFRSKNTFAYNMHPILGISTFVIPIIFYMMSSDKRLIRQMIKSNFNYRGNLTVKVAKFSTQVIASYFLFSVLTGFILNNSLYEKPETYKILSSIHGLAKYIVPIAMLMHITARIVLKRKHT